MSRPRNYTEDCISIQKRFFDTIARLVDTKSLHGGISGYCERHGIDKRHLYVQKKDMSRGYFDIGWVVPLVREYGIDAKWLLTGE